MKFKVQAEFIVDVNDDHSGSGESFQDGVVTAMNLVVLDAIKKSVRLFVEEKIAEVAEVYIESEVVR